MNRFLLPLSIFIVVVIFLGVGLRLNPREIPSPLVGKAAPDFSQPQLYDPANVFSPADLKGKVWLLNFWASWCIPCREKMNKLNSDHVTLNHQQYKIIYLSLDLDETKWKAAHFPFLNKTNSFRIRDGDNQFVKDFNIQSIPRYMLTDQSALISSKFSFE